MDSFIQFVEDNAIIIGTTLLAAFYVLMPYLCKRATRRPATFYIPKDQTITDDPQRRAKRRERRWCAIADLAGKSGKYAAVAILTALAIYPDIRYAFFVLAGNLLLLGIAIGTSMRWRSS